MKKEGLKLANRLNVSQSEKEGLNGWGGITTIHLLFD